MLSLQFPKLWLGLGWLLVIAVFVGSLLPLPAYPIEALASDKLVHFCSYLILTIWFGGLYGKPRNYVAIAAIMIAFGAALDLLQGLSSTRQFDMLDILANTAGAFVGFVALWLLLGGWCRAVERWITT